MNLTRCSSGHFYDSDKYGSCPHCSSSQGMANSNVTIPMRPDDSETVALVAEDIKTSTKSLSQPDDDQKTISYASQSIGTEPVVGWLVIVKGADLGADFKLKTGRNFIGRSSSMDVALKNDKTVSRDKHGIVVYDPKSCTYIVQPGASKELCYLNDEVVLSPQILKLNDIITVGETNLMFIPLCAKDGFNWDNEE
ncbi:MAG: FHA domain-containing protein [Lachnospirales bacterium]